MSHRKKFNVVREVSKIAKSTNRLRESLDAHSELLEQTRAKPANRMEQGNTAYEKKILHRFGSLVERHFYTKLVGVSFQNSDHSSRQEAIKTLEECQELELRREPQNKFDRNAILVCVQGESGVGYLDQRLAGEVTRSLNKGILWHCYVHKILHAPGTRNCGVTVFMVKLKNVPSDADSGSGMSGAEFLAKYYPDYELHRPAAEPQSSGKGSVGGTILFIILTVLVVVLIHSC